MQQFSRFLFFFTDLGPFPGLLDLFGPGPGPGPGLGPWIRPLDLILRCNFCIFLPKGHLLWEQGKLL